jgi:uncharacterized protein (DUF1800 family)
MASDIEPGAQGDSPPGRDGTSTALLRRRTSRRAVLAGGIAAAGVAGAYAAMGDRLRLFGDSGPTLAAVRADTNAIAKESVKINHLLRRAGFGVTREEYEHFQALGLQTTIEELLAYNAIDDTEAKTLANAANESGNNRVAPVSGWLTRMANTKRPLQEKITLFWHGLLTSQISVVRDQQAMLDQNEYLRDHALDNFPAILKGISMDPAMMIYLNVDNSNRAAPNENYARELMELFALGVGNFSEKDVREAARAFTGWQIPRERGMNPGQFSLGTPAFRPQRFDNGQKTFLGKTGNFRPEDIVDIIVEQPASAEYIVRRLFTFFVYPEPSGADLKPFAEVYTKNGKSIRSVVEAIFRSDVFYSPKAYRALVKSPVEYAVSAIKAVNGQARTADLAAGGGPRIGGTVGGMGQVLFEPPNVAGWPGNAAWLNASTLFARLNFINGVTGGGPQQRNNNNRQPIPAAGMPGTVQAQPAQPRNPQPAPAAPAFETGTATQALAHYLPLALDDNVSPEARQVLLDYAGGADVTLSAEQLRGLVYLVLGSPQFHLS